MRKWFGTGTYTGINHLLKKGTSWFTAKFCVPFSFDKKGECFKIFQHLVKKALDCLVLYICISLTDDIFLTSRDCASWPNRMTRNKVPKTFTFIYPRVNSFDALKQSTDICGHRITFSSRKFIILNKLSCFQSKHTFWEVREHLFLFKISLSTSVRAPLSLFWQTPVSTPFIGCWSKRFFSAQCSQGVLCIVQVRHKIISSS